MGNDCAGKLYDVAALRELDRRAITSLGANADEAAYALMGRAAQAAWTFLHRVAGLPDRVLVVCGPGNNGGDGYVLARLARAQGCAVEVVAVGATPRSAAAQRARADWQAAGGTVHDFDGALPSATLVVDALFGIGLSRAPEAVAAQAIAAINAARARGARVLALDVPSGLDAQTGATPGDCVQADWTVSFIADKPGLWTGQGPAVCGQRDCASLDLALAISDDIAAAARLLRASALLALPPRARTAHKGLHGHVLLIGGNHGMAGAALLAGRAALRAGAGLVSLATRMDHAPALAAAQPELMVHGIESAEALAVLMQRADSVAIGPGLGQDAWARSLYAHVLTAEKPLVVDADALNLLARTPRLRENWVLTPHPGEAARLLQTDTAAVERDRLHAVRELRRRYGGTVVLKGAGSLIAEEDAAPPWICAHGSPGMAVGGSGDVLTGIIAALRAQGLGACSARLGVLAHAVAGEHAALDGERGCLPGDLIAALRTVVNPVGSGQG